MGRAPMARRASSSSCGAGSGMEMGTGTNWGPGSEEEAAGYCRVEAGSAERGCAHGKYVRGGCCSVTSSGGTTAGVVLRGWVKGTETQQNETKGQVGQGEDAAQAEDAHLTSNIPHPAALGEALR